jgi:hypothetical protein
LDDYFDYTKLESSLLDPKECLALFVAAKIEKVLTAINLTFISTRFSRLPILLRSSKSSNSALLSSTDNLQNTGQVFAVTKCARVAANAALLLSPLIKTGADQFWQTISTDV